MADMIRCKNQLGEAVEIPKEKFKFRPSAYGLIIKDNCVLAMKNKNTGKYWFPGGGMEIHEDLKETLLREVREETNMEIEVFDCLFSTETFFYYQPDDEGYHMFLFFFRCEPTSSCELLAGTEMDPDLLDAEWVPIQDMTPERINDLTGSGDVAKKVCEYLQTYSA